MKAFSSAIILFIIVFIIARLVGYTASESLGCGGIGGGVGFVWAIVGTIIYEWIQYRKRRKVLKKFFGNDE